EAGLVSQRADEYYDVFYGRLIFPIINAMGEVVSFGGRVLVKNPDFAKYRNGSQTILFDKSKNLYAVNLLKKRKQREGVPYVIMCEGYMDVMSLHQAGFDMAVASMGTALTGTQAKLLKNYSDRIYISYDGDGAGQKATMRGLDILAEAGLNVKVVRLPDGMDPDDVVKTRGSEGYQALLDEAITLPAFKIETLKSKFDLSLSDEKAKFAVEAAKVIKALSNPVEQEEYLKLLHQITGYTLDALRKQTDISAIEQETVFEPQPQKPKARTLDKSLEFILASVLAQMPFCDYTIDLFPYLPDDFSRRVYNWGLRQFKEGQKAGTAAFYDETPEEDKSLLSELTAYRFLDGDDANKFAACAKALSIGSLTAQKNALAKEYDASHDVTLLSKVQEIDRKLSALRKGEDA
ncbi:MAG: toprim domain-containing protein, partial [Clostridiales bacterium]|nr:toprim domain-containing protein [Clostridiales bacterium]